MFRKSLFIISRRLYSSKAKPPYIDDAAWVTIPDENHFTGPTIRQRINNMERAIDIISADIPWTDWEDLATSKWKDATHQSRINFALQLEKSGHRCVKIRRTYPVQMVWCGDSECVLVNESLCDGD